MAGKLAILQIDATLGNVEANLEKIGRMIRSIGDKEVRVAVFCEYGTTGYSLDLASVAETVPGKTTEFLTSIAADNNIWISGGLVERGLDGKVYNTSVLISPEKGLVAKYRKVHPFSSEKAQIGWGEEPVIVETEIGPVGMTICYDLLFPEYIRGLVLAGARIILNSTFWFADEFSGSMGWSPEQTRALAITRALENGVFVAMACRTGTEKNLWAFGHSCIVGPQGKVLAEAEREESIIIASIDLQDIGKWSSYATYLQDRRPEIYFKLLDF